MKRMAGSFGCCIALVFCLAVAARGQGPEFWSAQDARHHGRLKAMLAEIQRQTPAAPVRYRRSFEETAVALQRAGRFRELGLTDAEGRTLLRAVFARLGIPEVSQPARRQQAQDGGPVLPGFRPRGEFEAMDAVLLAWPGIGRLTDDYVVMIRTILRGGAWIYLWVDTTGEQRRVERLLTRVGVDVSRIAWIVYQHDSFWMRDYGPVFVYNGTGQWALTDFHYYSSRPLDDGVPPYFAGLFGVPCVDRADAAHVVYTEGGNLTTDGRGTVVYSERTYEGNPGVNPSTIDVRITTALQATKAIVPQAPSLDGTGHVDMFLKVVDADTVVVAQYRPGQVDYAVLEECAALFAGTTNGDGAPWEVLRIPQPDVYYAFFLLPVVRTYTNGLIVNDQVIVPVYGIPEDAEALAILGAALPGRKLVPLNAKDIIESSGAWHCVTMEYPRP